METSTITPEDFDELLLWLDPERESAGTPDRARGALKYEAIRRRIIKIYQNRGCHTAEEIADETFNRVCKRVSELRSNYNGDPALYFYGVAKNVYRESIRRTAPPAPQPPPFIDPDDAEQRIACLDACLDRLDPNDRDLILKFYEGEKREKIDNRKRLATELGINTKALSLRTLRIRRVLLVCVRQCLEAAAL